MSHPLLDENYLLGCWLEKQAKGGKIEVNTKDVELVLAGIRIARVAALHVLVSSQRKRRDRCGNRLMIRR